MKEKNETRQSKLVLATISFIILGFGIAHCTPKGANASLETNAIRTLIVGGGESHDFEKWYKYADVKTLSENNLAAVIYTSNTDSIKYYLPEVDVLYLSNNQPIHDQEVRKAIFDFVEAGKGMILGHAALWYNWDDWPEYNQELVSGGSRGHDKYGSFNVKILDAQHPITNGVEKEFTLKDELYYFKEDTTGPGIEVLATASTENSEVFPSVFVVNHPKGRIVGIALGHDGESHDLPAYHKLLKNALKWAARKG